MTLIINDTTMTSDQSRHTARYSDHRNGWEVSWLPGRVMDRNTAITAMTLADAAAGHELHDRHQLWPHIQSWAGELGLGSTAAATMASQPPRGIDRQREPAGQHSDREAAD
jgi:hypothetical protein